MNNLTPFRISPVAMPGLDMKKVPGFRHFSSLYFWSLFASPYFAAGVAGAAAAAGAAAGASVIPSSFFTAGARSVSMASSK